MMNENYELFSKMVIWIIIIVTNVERFKTEGYHMILKPKNG